MSISTFQRDKEYIISIPFVSLVSMCIEFTKSRFLPDLKVEECEAG